MKTQMSLWFKWRSQSVSPNSLSCWDELLRPEQRQLRNLPCPFSTPPPVRHQPQGQFSSQSWLIEG